MTGEWRLQDTGCGLICDGHDVVDSRYIGLHNIQYAGDESWMSKPSNSEAEWPSL